MRTLGAVMILMILATAGASAGEGEDGMRGLKSAVLFVHANSLYDRGDYASAAEGYRILISRGLDDPSVWYNLGNAYASLDDLGRARAAYERARLLAPRDADLAHNLDMLKAHLKDSEPTREGVSQVAWLFTIDELKGTTSLAWFVGIGSLLWYLQRRRMGAALAASACLLVLLTAGSMLVIRLYGDDAPPRAVVVPTAARVYAGPGSDTRPGVELHAGAVVRVRGQDGDWRQVVTTGGTTGWMRSEELEPI